MMIIKGIDKRVGLIFYGDTVPEPLGSRPGDSQSLLPYIPVYRFPVPSAHFFASVDAPAS